MKKVLIMFWHGLGDTFMVSPVVREYRKAHLDHQLGWVALRRFGKTAREILNPEYVHEYFQMGDPWAEAGENMDRLYAYVDRETERLLKETGYDDALVVNCKHYDDLPLHKVYRFSREFGVDVPVDPRPEIYYTPPGPDEDMWGIPRPRVFFHCDAGNTRKTLSVEQARGVLAPYIGTHSILECGSELLVKRISKSAIAHDSLTIPFPLESLDCTATNMARCDRVVAIDSVVMHMAVALRLPTTVVFTCTPPEQVLFPEYSVEVLDWRTR